MASVHSAPALGNRQSLSERAPHTVLWPETIQLPPEGLQAAADRNAVRQWRGYQAAVDELLDAGYTFHN